MRNISKHISYKEAIRSSTAKRYSINNRPCEYQLCNMRMLAEKVFEPLREGLGDNPIYIASFYRCESLNTIIGGANNSQHIAMNGAAFDLDGDVFGNVTNEEIFDFVLNNLEFDQMIWEFGNDYNPEWVHISYKEGHNRNEVLRSYTMNGYTEYIKL